MSSYLSWVESKKGIIYSLFFIVLVVFLYSGYQTISTSTYIDIKDSYYEVLEVIPENSNVLQEPVDLSSGDSIYYIEVSNLKTSEKSYLEVSEIARNNIKKNNFQYIDYKSKGDIKAIPNPVYTSTLPKGKYSLLVNVFTVSLFLLLVLSVLVLSCLK